MLFQRLQIDWLGPTKHLLVQIQQQKHKKNVSKMLKVNSKDKVVLVSLLLTLNTYF